MDVPWAPIRWAICWCLLLTVIPIGYISPQAAEKPQTVTGTINLPEEVARFLGAPTTPSGADDGQQTGEIPPEVQEAGGEADSDDTAGSVAAPQAVGGPVSAPTGMETTSAATEDLAPMTATPDPSPGEKASEPRADASPSAGEAVKPPPVALPSLFTSGKDKSMGTYSYNPAGKVDPFEPLFRAKPVEIEKKSKKQRPKRVPRTPLEMVDLSQLKLSAIINAPSGDRALVEEASGKGYVVREGTPIGIHWGKVAAIKKDRVIVEEEVEDLMGDYVKRNREMKLNKPIGE